MRPRRFRERGQGTQGICGDRKKLRRRKVEASKSRAWVAELFWHKSVQIAAWVLSW